MNTSDNFPVCILNGFDTQLWDVAVTWSVKWQAVSEYCPIIACSSGPIWCVESTVQE